MHRCGMADINVKSLASHEEQDTVSSLLISVLVASSHAICRRMSSARLIERRRNLHCYYYEEVAGGSFKVFNTAKTFKIRGSVDC